MWALASPEWRAALEGWVGIEQTINDHEDLEKNRNWGPLLDRHEKRFGYRPDDTMIALLYDQGRAAAEAITNYFLVKNASRKPLWIKGFAW